MTGPDDIVARAGEPITLERAVDYEIDANGQVQTLETERVTTEAIVSQPTEEDEQRLEGRLSTGSLKMTLPSNTDVAADRDGQRDRIYRPELAGWGEDGWGDDGWGGSAPEKRIYEVVEVRDDKHPLTGALKLTIIADELDGRSP